MTRRPLTLIDRLPLRTPRLVLRRLTLADAADVAAMLADPDVMQHFPHPMTRLQADAWLHRNLERYERDGTGLFAVTLDDRWIGDCGLVRRQLGATSTLELGYHLQRQVWGLGYASEAAAACVALASAGAPDLPLMALIRSGNAASRRVASRLDFVVRGAVLHAGLAHERWSAAAGPSVAGSDRS